MDNDSTAHRSRQTPTTVNLAPVPEPARADTADWTWVLERACPDCGADVGALGVGDIAAMTLEVADRFATVLRGGVPVGQRPAPDVWSPLEYGAHVRDVFRLAATRLGMLLVEDDPVFADWDPNVTQVAERYDLQDPVIVADEVDGAASGLVETLQSLEPAQLDRPGRRSDGASFTVLTFSRYVLHDPLHHYWDVTKRRWDGSEGR